MDLIDIRFLENQNTLFLACSGGMDSMALAHILLQNEIKFSIAHCNFKLRDSDSDLDELFVRDFCLNHTIPFYTRAFHTSKIAFENGNSIEIEARNLRYHFFQELTDTYDIDLFLTAHHSDDQAETILMRIIQGTGLKGLKGIPKHRAPNYYRPLLSISKYEIETFVLKNKIQYRTDQSNFSSIYLRNKLRNHILPSLEEINKEIKTHLNQLSEIAIPADALLEEFILPYKAQWNSSFRVDLNALNGKEYLPLVIYSLLENYKPNKTHIETICENLFSTESKLSCIDLTTFELKNGILEKVNSFTEENKTLYSLEDFFLNERFSYQIIDFIPKEYESSTTYIDIEQIKFPLKLLPPLPGQIIRPIGMSGNSKKVSNILQQSKMSLNKKNNTILIEDSENEIICIVGHCTSQKVRIKPSTKQVLVLKAL